MSESLAYGVPIVAWPMAADQMFNAEWLEKEGVGLLVKGTGNIPERIVPRKKLFTS